MLDCVIIGEMQDDKRDKAGPCETGDKAEKHSDQLHLIVPGHNILDTQSVVLVEKTPTKVLLCPSPGTLLNNIGQKSSPDFRVLEDKNKLWSKKENTSSVPNLNAVSIASVTPVLSYSNFHEMVSADQVKEEDEIRKCLWLGCNHTFPCLSDLVNHVNDVHVKVEREVEYKCNWKDCLRKGRGFNARYKMLIHIRTHTTEKPHKCTICNKCFSRLENLKIHHRSHTGEKPYTCHFPGCSKAYSNSSDRFKHVRTHQVNKPYACKMPNCTKRYTDPSSLRKHVKTLGHHFRRAAFTGSMDDLTPNNSKHSHNDLSNGHVRNSDVHTPISPPVAILSTSTVTAHLISISSNQLSALASNPLLSSAIMPSTAIARKEVDSYNGPEAARESSLSLVESPTKELSAELPLLSEESQKLPDQETPLDLSTGLINSNNADSVAEVCIGEDNADYSPKWELVSTD